MINNREKNSYNLPASENTSRQEVWHDRKGELATSGLKEYARPDNTIS